MYSRECTAYTVSSFSRNNSYSAFKFVNAKGMLFIFQVLAEMVLIPHFLIREGILNILFGNICFKNNIVTLLIDLIKIFFETNAICVNKNESFPPTLNGFLKTSPENKNIQ